MPWFSLEERRDYYHLCQKCGEPMDADWRYSWCQKCGSDETCRHGRRPVECNECMVDSDRAYDASREIRWK